VTKIKPEDVKKVLDEKLSVFKLGKELAKVTAANAGQVSKATTMAASSQVSEDTQGPIL
jgi:hypothetical protein